MSLRAIAAETLARIGHETSGETSMKQTRQGQPCFIDTGPRFIPMKQDLARNTAVSDLCFTVSFPRDGTHETSASLASQLGRLRNMPPPRGVDRNAWRQVVADAGRLVADGWAEDALALGWTVLDLFGCEPLGSDDDYRNGLAVWLAGRPLVLLDADSAIARVDGHRFMFNRKRDRSGCVLLWELGR
jgi:hypothetical protein